MLRYTILQKTPCWNGQLQLDKMTRMSKHIETKHGWSSLVILVRFHTWKNKFEASSHILTSALQMTRFSWADSVVQGPKPAQHGANCCNLFLFRIKFRTIGRILWYKKVTACNFGQLHSLKRYGSDAHGLWNHKSYVIFGFSCELNVS